MRILHLQSSFAPGGKELRAAKLINAFGKGVEHTIVSAQPEALGAAAAIDPRIAALYPRDFPPLAGKPLPGRLQRLARAMQGFDLVLTYNWGAMDAVMAHTLLRDVHALPPLVHHEDGFNEDEATARKRSRNWYRRIALGRASALVVPSRQLEAIALGEWHQPAGRVVRIGNGIDTAAYAKKARPDALPRVIKRPGEKWLGTLAGLRPVKNLPRLVRAFAGLPEEWQLVILGEGPERGAIGREAVRLNVAHRVHLPGFVAEPAKAVGLFDLFALSSDSEQFPISVVEAMAGGLAVAATDVGDVATMLAETNRAYVTPPGDEAALAAALVALAENEALRRGIGEANRRRARAEYDEKTMIAAYRAVYARALRRPAFP
ncbi:MAG: glycosyltransferase family 4 protein [Sphingomonadales bacterium]|nr:glycosyltransferase family 4 protein [Sphingomonadales bacterium]